MCNYDVTAPNLLVPVVNYETNTNLKMFQLWHNYSVVFRFFFAEFCIRFDTLNNILNGDYYGMIL